MSDSLSLMLAGKIEGITRKMNEVTYNVIAEIIQRLDRKSPVGEPSYWKHLPPKGYSPGQFRANWQLGVDSRPMGILSGFKDPSGVSTVGANISLIPQAASRHKYYLVNNLPYATALEYGHSPQCPPHGMMGSIRDEFHFIVTDVANSIKANGGRVR